MDTPAGSRFATLRPRLGPWGSVVGDVVAVAFLAAILVWLAWHDGGWARDASARVALIGLVAVPVAARELTRLPRPAALAVGAWPLGLLLSFAFAAERSGFVRPMLVLGLMPVIGLVTLRVWRRPWGPLAMLALLLVGFGAYWQEAFLAWWGMSMGGGTARWLPLSWHNQAGTLMGAFGLMFAGLALTSGRTVALAGGLAAAGGLAGVWLSASRGAIVAVAVGLLVVGVAVLRDRDVMSVAVRAAGLVGGAALVVSALTAMMPPEASTGAAGPITDRTDIASPANLEQRFHHAAASWRMFVDRPLTGHGPGSYREVSPAHTSPRGTLTSSAHNEYIEALGEGGIALGAPVLLVALVALRVILTTLGLVGGDRTTRASSSAQAADDLTRSLSVGAIGALAALGLHAAIDFDWDYLVLAGLLSIVICVGASSVWPSMDDGPRRHVALSVIGGTILASVLLIGLLGAYAERAGALEPTNGDPVAVAAAPVPWDLQAARTNAIALTERGHLDAARHAIDRSLAWNPGNDSLRVHRATIDLLDDAITPDHLVEITRRAPFRFATHNRSALVLMETGNHEEARALLQEAISRVELYRRWGITRSALHSWQLYVHLEAETVGCERAREVAVLAADEIPTTRRIQIDVHEELRRALKDACPEG